MPIKKNVKSKKKYGSNVCRGSSSALGIVTVWKGRPCTPLTLLLTSPDVHVTSTVFPFYFPLDQLQILHQ